MRKTKRYDTINEVPSAQTFADILKFNPYHDKLGRFTTPNSYTLFTIQTRDPDKQHWADKAIAREKDRYASGAQDGKPKGGQKQHTHRPESKLNEGAAANIIQIDTGVDAETAKTMYAAVNDFTCSGFDAIRSYQCSGKPPHAKEKADTIERFISKSPQWDDGAIYRGIHVTPEAARDIVKQASAGKLFDQRGMSSWTTDEGIARSFMGSSGAKSNSILFRSKGAQQGTSIKHLSEYPNEKEIIMSSKARWKASAVRQISATVWEIECDAYF